MKIALASDHAGFPLKQFLKQKLFQAHHEVVDYGCDSSSRCDYPGFAFLVTKAVANKAAERGLLICGSGIGMCMAANRLAGIRAVVLRDEYDARISREHNDANVACLGARVTDSEKAWKLLELFLTTPFSGGRHILRLEKLDLRNF